MIIKLPSDVGLIIDKLSPHEAYAVGGCVRDSLLGLAPKDWDICTSAEPSQVMEIFKDYHVIETGLKHGTVTVMINDEGYEITTFRVDGDYTDCRRPTKVTFVRNLTEDLARRDFTINAMAYNDKVGLVDCFGGREDLQNKIIRCVGDPIQRFSEDALRIVRALRFAAVYQFTIDQPTANAITELYPRLKKVSVERFDSELSKILLGDNMRYILSDFWYVFDVFIPEIKPMVGFKQHNPHHIYDVWEHTLVAVENAEKDLNLRLTMLLHDIGKPSCFTRDDKGVGHFYRHELIGSQMAKERLVALKFDNRTIAEVSQLINCHCMDLICKRASVKRWLNKLGEEQYRKLLKVRAADISAHHKNGMNKLKSVEHILSLLDDIIAQNQCFHLKDLQISGKDLVTLGITQGKEIGTLLNCLLIKVMDGEIENDRELLLKWVAQQPTPKPMSLI